MPLWKGAGDVPLDCEELEVSAFHVRHGHVRNYIREVNVAVCHDRCSGRVQEEGEGSEGHGGRSAQRKTEACGAFRTTGLCTWEDMTGRGHRVWGDGRK